MNNLPSAGDQFLALIKQIVEENIDNENFSVEDLADGAGLSRSRLHRKLTKLSGKSATEFITDIRITRAKELLENDVATVSEIAYRVGFRSPSYFIKVFKTRYKVSPGDLRKGVEGNPVSSTAARKPEIQTSTIRKRYRDVLKGVVVLLMIVIVAGGIHFLTGLNERSEREKSLAVLPFINDSPDEENLYFINGIMESILDNLGKIEDLRVASRNSVEQYRNHPKPTPVVAEELNVSYLVEGSGQMEGDRIRLSIQLIDARNDKHVWSDIYNRSIDEIFELQSEIAQLVAEEIKAVITPEEKGLIEKIPTESQTAYDLYLNANQEINNATDRASYERGIYLCRLALKYDSSFAFPYMLIARAYSLLNWRNPLENAGYLDSVIYYVNLALSMDPQLEYGYQTRGRYYRILGKSDSAIADFDRATEINPNFVWAYSEKGWVHFENGDFINSIENFSKCLQLARGPELPQILYNLGMIYNQAGFHEKYKEILVEKIALDRDTMGFYRLYSYDDLSAGNYSEAIGTAMKGYAMDSTDIEILNNLGKIYYNLRLFDSARYYFDRYLKLMEEKDRFVPFDMFAAPYTYQKTGEQEKAQYYTTKLFEYYKNTEDHYFLAFSYMLMGEIDKVYDHLSELARSKKYSIWDTEVRHAPIFDEISSEPEFLNIVDQIEAKYQAGHERVRQWLEENGML